MISMTVFVKVRSEKRQEFLLAVRSINSDREIQNGLTKSTVYQETDDQTGFSLIYEWETQQDCERYLLGENFRVLLGALRVLCEKSEIRCSCLSEKLRKLACGT